MNNEIIASCCEHCKLQKPHCQCSNGQWLADYESVAGTFRNYGIEHDYRFSHYEEDRYMGSTTTINGKHVIMICRHCGNYVKNKVF